MRIVPRIVLAACLAATLSFAAQDPPPATPDKATTAAQATPAPQAAPAAPSTPSPDQPKTYQVDPGTRVPLSLINSVSTKNAANGDRVYLETAFPIVVSGRIVIPPGSYVAGTITDVKRPGKVKGRGELYLRFDSLTLPNGVTRDFRARVDSLDGSQGEHLDRNEGKIKSEGNKSGDAITVAETASAGAGIGGLAGVSAGHTGLGVGVGAAAGATAGLIGVLLTRGPDAVLARGSTIEMVLDRPVTFDDKELDFSKSPPSQPVIAPGPDGGKKNQPLPARRWPI